MPAERLATIKLNVNGPPGSLRLGYLGSATDNRCSITPKPGLILREEPLSTMRKEIGNGLTVFLHATVTHSHPDCPLYEKGNILAVVDDARRKRDDIAQKHGITLYWMVSGAPEHVSYALLESDHIDKVTQFLHECS